MIERLERIAGAFMVGWLLSTLVIVWLGLMNEGFSSVAFLLYPGPETWLQFALVGVFMVLVALSLPVLRANALRVTATGPISVLVAGLSGVVFAGTLLYLIALGETPWRKFYTYVVAPRAVSAWLVGAIVVLLVSRRLHARRSAA